MRVHQRVAATLVLGLLSGVEALAPTAARVVDFRSDTVTQPTASMREAMKCAEVGDDVFGDDPTVQKLERRIADLLGKEAGVFVPSGTMGNLVCMLSHCRERGSEYIVGDQAHIYIFEQGGAAQFGGCHPRALVTAPDGTVGDAATIEAAIRPDNEHFPVTKVVALESTHNLCGGAVLSQDYVDDVCGVAHTHGVAAHLDGARAWHAAAALHVPIADYVRPFDSVSVCLSKALGAPVGSVVVGEADFVKRCRKLRKGLGGTTRQVGVLAAAGLVALDEILPNLGGDHARCARLAEGLAALGFAVEPPTTNLLYFSVGSAQTLAADAFVAACDQRGVRLLVVPGAVGRMRIVTHHQVDDDGVARALEVFAEVVEKA